MSRALQTTIVVVTVLLTLVTGCSKQDKDKDKVVSVQSGDPDMAAAIAEARRTLPEFWKVFDKRERGESDFAMKVKITDGDIVEYFWLIDLERGGGKTMGTINNTPNGVTNVKLGDRIEIPEVDIADWLYFREGKMVGNRTLKPLFKEMPAEEVARLKEMMADPS
ncbi:DUF2314 domain-containing protein [Roseimicrobium sp. ORNL1]|uniref:YegJ family protein n=1 Tax=Roseimicrobium sp. ORNL1 TaxID=2711231 RepID=UPI0013E186BD|nr:DUF2314 domain-containing protein [Roseimicrobium sp. ORNL1]QIF04814.1 DUF2314 domain-containing protein [Roseimicrobium sp. ORNL1]